jgi:hypothetical protein
MGTFSTLVTLSLASLIGYAAAQIAQTGLLYWCAYNETGTNFKQAGYPNVPRTYPGAVTYSSQVCHMTHGAGPNYFTSPSDGVNYNFSNGTTYPPNIVSPSSVFAISPSACQVRLSYQI